MIQALFLCMLLQRQIFESTYSTYAKPRNPAKFVYPILKLSIVPLALYGTSVSIAQLARITALMES